MEQYGDWDTKRPASFNNRVFEVTGIVLHSVTEL